jgi:hypothetical protein
MYIDKRHEFADATEKLDTGITDVIDLGSTNTTRDIASGKPLFLVIQVDTAVTRAAGACTVTFSLESDSTANLATSATIHAATSAIAKATLVAGYQTVLALPPGEYERYLGVRLTFSAAADTGKFNIFITDNVDTNRAYADAL